MHQIPKNSNTNWSIETVKTVIESTKTNEIRQKALKVLGCLGIVIAVAVLVPVAIFFSAKILIPAAVIGITSIGWIVLGVLLKRKINQKMQEKGLTPEKRAEVAADHFKGWMEKKAFDYETTHTMENDLHKVSSIFVLPRYNQLKNEQPEFLIQDQNLTDEKVVELLMAAQESGVVLHLQSLEKLTSRSFDEVAKSWVNIGVDKQERDKEIDRSFLISAKFVNKCLDRENVDVQVVNRQLNALAVKYIPLSSAFPPKAVKPSVVIGDNKTVTVQSHQGELAVEQVLGDLDRTGVTLVLKGIGFRLASKNWNDGEWNDYIQKFTFTTTYKSEIIDLTAANSSSKNDFWQTETPKTGTWTPSAKELWDYEKKKQNDSLQKT